MTQWKVSAGTACVIGIKKMKADVLPTTAYLMLGEKCSNNCQFCAQSRSSEARSDQLSRVTWPTVSEETAAAGIGECYEGGTIKRACLQVVHNSFSWDTTVSALDVLQDHSPVPVCVSSHLETAEQAHELIVRGADRVCIALDAATPAIYEQVKDGQWAAKWNLLLECAQVLPERMTTHLIVGLGESEQEMVNRIAECINRGITVGLFAFTPVRGTPWANQMPPSIARYRRIQIAHHLLKCGYQRDVIAYQQGSISSFRVPEAELLRSLAGGQAFQTSGCDDCNRPYYNERPGGLMYNYPRPLTAAEVIAAINECEMIRGEYDEVATD